MSFLARWSPACAAHPIPQLWLASSNHTPSTLGWGPFLLFHCLQNKQSRPNGLSVLKTKAATDLGRSWSSEELWSSQPPERDWRWPHVAMVPDPLIDLVTSHLDSCCVTRRIRRLFLETRSCLSKKRNKSCYSKRPSMVTLFPTKT